MIRFTRHFRVGFAALLAVLLGVMPIYASATPTQISATVATPDVFITEFQTNGGVAAQEFIELYNATDQDITFDDTSGTAARHWQLQFFNSTSVKAGTPAWTTPSTPANTITLSGTISAKDYFIIASAGYQPGGTVPDQSYTAASSHLMTDTGGGLQLLSTDVSSPSSGVSVHDRVMWLGGSADSPRPEGVLASPSSGKSLQRLPNGDSEYFGEDAVLSSFGSSSAISPLDAWQPPVVFVPLPVPDTPDAAAGGAVPADGIDDGDGPAAPVIDATTMAAPQISELLPNPASPLTDAADEYIEIYNPNSHDFDLNGYSLEVGTTTLRTFTLTDTTIIPPYGYSSFYSAETRLPLPNSGGQARVRDRLGAVVSETDMYNAAGENQSWARSGDAWQWSSTPTPNEANKVTSLAVATKTAAKAAARTAVASKTPARAATAKKAAAKAATAKSKGATTIKKVKAKAAPKKKKVKAAATSALSPAGSMAPKTPIHTGILVAVVVAAVLYGLYEYRHDIAGKFRQFREHRKIGNSRRDATSWRRGYSSE